MLRCGVPAPAIKKHSHVMREGMRMESTPCGQQFTESSRGNLFFPNSWNASTQSNKKEKGDEDDDGYASWQVASVMI